MKRTAILFANLLLAAFSLAICLVLAEQVLRAVGYEQNPLKVQVGNTADARLYHVFEDRHFVYDPELIWRPKSSHGVFNSQGYRGPEMTVPKPQGSLRVVAIGDSNTLGWDGAGGANWPGFLHRLLSQQDPRFSVINAGVYGYSSYQGVIRFRQSLQYQPDLALISFGSNDAHPVTVTDHQFAERGPGRSGWTTRLARFRLWQLWMSAWRNLVSWRSGGLQARVPVEDYRNNLTEIIRLGKKHGVGVVLLTRPYIGRRQATVRWKTFVHRYNAATAEVAGEQGVPLVDLYSHFKRRRKLFADESHFTGEGHRRAARIVYEVLQPMLP